MEVQMYDFGLNIPKKRRIVSEKECKLELKEAMPLFFQAFRKAFTAYEKEVVMTRPEARARGFEASLLNSKMIESIQNFFPRNWKFAKYKRFVLGVKGYVVLFKKLNGKDMPMNIKTKAVDAISNQLSLPLFNENGESAENPILFFGYKKDRIGNISDAKLVYILDGKVKWSICENDIEQGGAVKVLNTNTEPSIEPVVREGIIKKLNTNNN